MIEFVANLLRFSAPVTIAAVGETVGQKSGIINIGLEGMMLLAAYVSVDVTGRTGNPWIGLAAGTAVGLLVALVQSLFTVVWAKDQVVVGTAVNLFALGLTSTLFQTTYGASGQLIKVEKLPIFAQFWDPVLILLPILIVATGWMLFRSKWGLALRASGEYPAAVESAGYSVPKLRLQAQAVAGLFAGLAGSYLTLGIAPGFAENMTEGRGFVAIAMVTFGRWRPWLVVAASLLVGFTDWLRFALQGQSGIPLQFFQALPYLVALAVLIAVGRGTVAPASLAVPYKREK